MNVSDKILFGQCRGKTSASPDHPTGPSSLQMLAVGLHLTLVFQPARCSPAPQSSHADRAAKPGEGRRADRGQRSSGRVCGLPVWLVKEGEEGCFGERGRWRVTSDRKLCKLSP